jgi:hypothetical protein
MLGATDIPNRGVDDRREAVAIYERKLAAAKKQRDALLLDMRKASARADAGDKPARLEVASLSKQDLAVGRLVSSIEMQLAEAKKWLAMAVDQAAMVEAKRAGADAATVPRDKLFETMCPDGRVVRHRAESLDALRKALLPNYVVRGQIFGADADGNGGFTAPISSSAPTIMESLLDAFGDQLLAWLAERGIIGSDKTVVVLPANGRELQ